MVNYSKSEEGKLQVEVPKDPAVIRYSLEELKSAKAKHEAKVEEFDVLIAEAGKLGVTE